MNASFFLKEAAPGLCHEKLKRAIRWIISCPGRVMNADLANFHLVPTTAPAASPSYAAKFMSTALARGSMFFRTKTPIDPTLAECPETHIAYVALYQLLNTQGEFYSNAVISEYLQVLSDSYPESFHYEVGGVTHLVTDQKTPFELAVMAHKVANERLTITDIALPYNNNEHHVVIYIDLKAKKVEYYDPFGLNSADKKSRRGLSFSMREELEKIQLLFFGSTSSFLVENTTPHQECLFRCGIWGLYYIDRRIRGRSAEELHAEKLGTAAIDTFKREEVAHRIQERAIKLLQIAKTQEAPDKATHTF